MDMVGHDAVDVELAAGLGTLSEQTLYSNAGLTRIAEGGAPSRCSQREEARLARIAVDGGVQTPVARQRVATPGLFIRHAHSLPVLLGWGRSFDAHSTFVSESRFHFACRRSALQGVVKMKGEDNRYAHGCRRWGIVQLALHSRVGNTAQRRRRYALKG